MKDFSENLKLLFKNKDNRKKIIFILGGIVIFLFVIILVIKNGNRKMSYTELEDQLISATESYLKDHKELYPNRVSPSYTIDSSTLVTEKYIKKEIGKLVKDSCSATVEVIYNNETYHMVPNLTCSHYQTKNIYDKVLMDNPVISDGNGLYDLNEMLTFRGDQVKNYVKFHNILWRIVKMDPVDFKIYLILDNLKDIELSQWDNRYNTTEESKHGINDYSVSVIHDTILNLYQAQFSEKEKSYLLPMDICIGKRSETESVNDGSIECSNNFTKEYISLLPLYDYINASYDYQCKSAETRACANYNYLVSKAGKWWTLTADGSKGTKAYGINYSGVITSDYTDGKKYPRVVLAIDGRSIYRQGDGTSANPYLFK